MVVVAIGPTGVYLLVALLILIVLGGGTYVGYRMNRGKASDRPEAMGTGGGGTGGEEP